ncbi:MAG TPA: hypothetical protein PKJ41_14300 [Bryobacteraceae bacterium]|nr:hypothetical protein [Bryobacteraceae bacterium]HPT25919.1 hypothetical protein [Bryobacteraceae bacterium]
MIKQMVLVCVVAALPAAGQQVKLRTEQKAEHVVQNKMVFTGTAVGGGSVMHTIEFTGTVKKGAPYAAESVTETVQVLADGNRIVNKQSGKEYRDSEGRMRRDSTIQPAGPWVTGSKTSMMSMIDDPVSGEHVTLNHDEKVAHKMTKLSIASEPVVVSETEKNVQKEVRKEVRVETRHQARPTRTATATTTVVAGMPLQDNVVMWAHAGGGEGAGPKVEALGKRVIEGVECEGTKTVMTIDTGMIGNERPIEIVTERWQSADLGVDVLRKHSDPRFGETNYRLQGIVRGEQPRSLFEAPADYKTEDLGGAATEFKIQRKSKE